MGRIERKTKSLKFSKAFGVLLQWVSCSPVFQECIEKDWNDVDSDCIQEEFEDYLPRYDKSKNSKFSQSKEDQILGTPNHKRKDPVVEILQPNDRSFKEFLSKSACDTIIPRISEMKIKRS